MAQVFSVLVLVWLVWFLLLLRIAVHEAGHLIAAIWVGLPVTRATVGRGPRLLAVTLRSGIGIRLYAWPRGGCVDFAPGVNVATSRFAVMAAAGPLLEILVVPVAAYYLLGSLQALIFAGAALANLYPRRVMIGGRLRPSDGMWLARVWRRRGRGRVPVPTLAE